jgi:hypothetical protein
VSVIKFLIGVSGEILNGARLFQGFFGTFDDPLEISRGMQQRAGSRLQTAVRRALK